MPTFQTFPSPFGPLAIVTQDHPTTPVVAIMIPSPTESAARRLSAWPDIQEGHSPRIDALCHQLARYLDGEPLSLSTELLDWSVCSPFQRRVLLAEYAIPRGQVRTYAQVAQRAGSPRAARAAGGALAANPFPIVIPCHRAVRSDGSLGGYYGGLDMKRALLHMEGVRFDGHGRIDLAAYGG